MKAWLLERSRWHVRFTPTSASWLNQTERFFALLTQPQHRRGVYRSVGQLQGATQACIDANNADPKPFRRTKTADDILASIGRLCLRNTETTSAGRTSGSGY